MTVKTRDRLEADDFFMFLNFKSFVYAGNLRFGDAMGIERLRQGISVKTLMLFR
jgi:hypothetical protein